jgi:hypothetical protein
MHPTADTPAFIISQSAGRRVMPGVMPPMLYRLSLGLIMKHPVKFSVSVWVAVLLSNATGVAQSQFPQEAGRGFPYSSGGESWWPVLVILILLIVLGIIIGIAGKVKDTLADQPRWHTFAVMVATVLAALLSSGALNARYEKVGHPVEWGTVVFMLVPSFVGIGLLYLAIMELVQMKRDR